jgi:raffinose/stachyose/melibiose transport system permease protein
MAAIDTATAAPAIATTAPRRKKRKPVLSIFQWITLIVIALFVLVPLYTTVLGGFKEVGELRVNPFGLPNNWDPVRFTEILGGSKYFASMANSLLIAVGSVVLSILLSSMTAFAFAHIKFFGSKYRWPI